MQGDKTRSLIGPQWRAMTAKIEGHAQRGRGPAGVKMKSHGDLLREAIGVLVLMTVLNACATQPEQDPYVNTSARSTAAVSNPAAASDSPPAEAVSEPTTGPVSMVSMGTGELLAPRPERPPIRLDGDAVMLNVEQAPLSEVVHTILGDTLGLDYVVEHPVGGEITLRTRSPVPRDQLLTILESLLRNNNVLMIRGPNDRFFISGSPTMKSTVPSFESAPTTGFSNVIVPLQYISASEMAEILKPVAREDTFVRIDNGRNLLILAGTQMQLTGWLDIIATFDVDRLAGMSVGVFPISNSEVEEVYEELEHILMSSASEGGEGAGLASLIRVMPVERLNSIMVVSPRAHYIDTVRQWVEKLDNVQDPASEPTLQIYPVRNGDAAQLAGLLSTIYGGSGGGGGKSSGVAPGMEKATSGGGTSTAAGGSGKGTSGGTFSLDDDIRVVADEFNNTLLVYATPYEYQKISRILQKLDRIQTQVLIEASIVEVQLVGDLQYGIEWMFNNNLGGGDTGTGMLDLGGGLQPTTGFSYQITNSAVETMAVINALATKSLINVISTPSVMVLDNHTAMINVGNQQPIQDRTTVSDGGVITNSITYKDTGVQLTVTPSVNDGGLVTLEIEQAVTDVGPVDVATGQRSFLARDLSSTVAIRDGDSIVLGGLIQDNETTGKTGVPLLMDIPVLGSLFSTTGESNSRTELLVFITPRVMESEQDLRALNNEMRNRMSGIPDFEDLPVNFEAGQAETEGE